MAAIAILPFLLMFAFWSGRLGGWRQAFLAAGAVWGGMLIFLTELLSRFDSLAKWPLVCGWLAMSFVVIGTYRFVPHFRPIRPQAADWMARWIVGFLVCISFVLGIVAFIGPANSFDSMTYHIPRIVHWIQDRNVEFYPVQSYSAELNPVQFFKAQQIRQLVMAPGDEYVMLHFRAMESDRLANMVQWFAFIGCLIGVWTLGELLGAGTRACALAALFAGTLPMACLQAVSTQNDLVLAFWLICFVCLMRRMEGWFHCVLCGVALGLALLTQATAYLYAAPLALAWAVIQIYRQRWPSIGRLAAACFIAALINLPTYARNFSFNGTLLGDSPSGLPYTNASYTFGATASNLIRNIALEIAFPPGRAAAFVETAARKLDHALGQEVNDPDTTFLFQKFNLAYVNWKAEDSTPNPAQFVLLVAAILALRKMVRPAHVYLAALAIGFLLFCAVLRWQPWHSRLHMPLFLLAAPCVGMAMTHWKTSIQIIIATILSAAVCVWIICNSHHPLAGRHCVFTADRDALRFIEQPRLQEPFEKVAQAADGCRQVGFIFTADDWEYPLEALILARNPTVRFETYPQPDLIRPETRNRGWDANLKPYVVIRFDQGVPSVAGRSE